METTYEATRVQRRCSALANRLSFIQPLVFYTFLLTSLDQAAIPDELHTAISELTERLCNIWTDLYAKKHQWLRSTRTTTIEM